MYGMSNCSRVDVNFIIVSSFVRLVSKEMNLTVAFVLNMSERISLVPSGREDVKRYLAADGIRQAVRAELFPEGGDEGFADVVDVIVSLKV